MSVSPQEEIIPISKLDGGGHYTKEQRIKDEQRTNDLNAMNLTVVRICNLDIDRNFCGVCEFIDRLVQNSLPQSLSVTAPSSEQYHLVKKTSIC